MTVTYCPVCDRRTVHNRVRPHDGVGTRLHCREHTDVGDRIEAGEVEVVR
jgi:hypothetical protein